MTTIKGVCKECKQKFSTMAECYVHEVRTGHKLKAASKRYGEYFA